MSDFDLSTLNACPRCKAPADEYGARECACETCADCGKLFPEGTLMVAPTDGVGRMFGEDGRCDPCWEARVKQYAATMKAASRRSRGAS